MKNTENEEAKSPKSEKEMKEYYKATVDHFVEDIRKTCHAMIEGKHVCGSPVELVKEALSYIDEYYKDAKKDEKQRNHKFE